MTQYDFMDFDGFAAAESAHPSPGPSIPEPMDCLRCGYCLSSCPTYQITTDEQESPRQRIRTLSHLLVEKMDVGDEALEHLNNCVQCKACESVCPSHIDYTELFEQAQQQLTANHRHGLLARLTLKMVANRHWFNAMLPLVWFYQVTGIQSVMRNLNLLQLLGLSRIDRMAPQPELQPLQRYYPVKQARGCVALFTGCIADRFDRRTLASAIKLLNHIGFEVVVPRQQVCCGSIHFHNGEQETGRQLMQKNLEAFAGFPVDAVVYAATGCGGMLHDYARILPATRQSTQFHNGLSEICEFVDAHWPEDLFVHASDKTVLVHEPCSQRNALRKQQSVYQLLKRIPGLKIRELQDNHLCCGAGGSYMLTHPPQSDAMRDLKCRQLHDHEADYLVTGNIGCALHLATAIPSDKPLQLLHPIELIVMYVFGNANSG